VSTALTFIVPVRHQDNAKDWSRLKANLTQTLASISNQTSGSWKAIVVANEGADLPALPKNVEALRVTFPPNTLHEKGNATQEEFYEAFRMDKGRRVLAAMLAAESTSHFMIVDDDDLVSGRLAEFVARNPLSNGWVVKQGYVWTDQGSMLFAHPNVNSLCGSTLIVRAALYGLPATASGWPDERIAKLLGSHRQIADHLSQAGTPLEALPFPGTIYRIGHAGNHSGKGGIADEFFWNRRYLRRPWSLGKNLLMLRPITRETRQEFFGAGRAN
jgi:hypothetical protein